MPGTKLDVIATYNMMHVGIFLKTTISFHLNLIGFTIFKVKAHILGFGVFFFNTRFWI